MMIRMLSKAALLVALGASARAGTIQSLDGTQGFSFGGVEHWLTGMVGPYTQLIAHGHTVLSTPSITPAALSGVDVVVTGLLAVGATLSASEEADLRAWVFAGGSVLLVGENANFGSANAQFSALVDGPPFLGTLGGAVTSTLADPGHPIANGPGGPVDDIAGLLAVGRWGALPAGATAVYTNPDGSGAIVALTYGQGRAVLTNDTAYFADPPTYDAEHAALWDNVIAWLLDGSGGFPSFCAGDGSAGPCPCANAGSSGKGCDNSASTGGARLKGDGTTSPDTLQLLASGELPTALSIFLQGNLQLATPVPFGDGIRCIGGVLKRLAVKNAVGGEAVYPSAGELPVGVHSAGLGDPIAPGSTRWYQTYYRDPALAFCPNPPGNSWNVTNAVEVVW